jgi:NAD+ synthase (glutamine-hydrolysing)
MVRVALAQMNLPVGDIDGNVTRISDAIARAESEGAQILALPELAITGYPPEDLLLKRSFVTANIEGLQAVAAATKNVLTMVGFVDPGKDRLYNAAAICQGGRVLAVYRKHLLPNYGVFDEQRYFESGRGHTLVDTNAGVIGVCVCEDAWSDRGPVISQGDAGAQVVVNINASPFHKGKRVERIEMLCDRARSANTSIVYVNMVGGQDELVFDGGSLVIDPKGDVVGCFPQFEEHFGMIDVPLGEAGSTEHPSVRRIEATLPEPRGEAESASFQTLGAAAEVYEALKLALADYAAKTGFHKAVIGLSGGIDSSLTAAIAADALGADNVLGIAMPSEFSSSHSVDDAKALAANLGIDMLEISITRTFHAYLETLQDAYGEVKSGLAEENLQARIRGNILMATSNRYGHLVLATGNKSELACGYATLYGDMAGGFALLKDVFKTEVYELCRYRNSISEAIPENVMTKPPSAELRPDQKDSDSLPPYDVLDPILELYIEEDAGITDIVAKGHDAHTVERVVALVDRAEFKRRQAPPGPKVTTKAFGRDRRLPISNRWREGRPGKFPPKSVGPTNGEED